LPIVDTLETAEQLKEKRILRVLMTDFPQYLAVVSRLRQEIALIGSDGGVLSSTVVPQVQAVFPEGALQKRIRVGLQAHQVPPEMVTRLVGNQVTVSPIVTIEPRRRKFHKPITLTIPLPRSALNSTTSTGKRHHHGGADSAANSSLRLLCSITGGTAPAVWEDITGSTPLSRVKDCVSFTTTVSARLWLIDCPMISASVEVAMRLYKEASAVPYMGKFIVFAKRPEVDEALMRCFCITDDKVDKTLECQEGFDLVAASNEIEVVDNRPTWLETSGNLVPVCKADDQLRLHFNAFRENRLAFPVRIKDPQLEPSGKLAFVQDPRPGSTAEIKPMLQEMGGTAITDALPVRPICGLDVVLPTEIDGTRSGSVLISGADGAHTIASTAATSVVSLSCSQPQHFEHPTQKLPDIDSHGRSLVVPPPEWTAGRFFYNSKSSDLLSQLIPTMTEESIARTHLDLVEISAQVGSDWPRLVKALFAPDSTELPPSADQLIDWISHRCASADTLSAAGLTNEGLRSDRDRALAILLAWTIEAGDAATGNELDHVLREIGREDIVKNCMRDIRPVLEGDERERASDQINNAGRGWTPEAQTLSLTEMSPPPQQTQDMAVTSLSSELFTDQLESGQLESSGDLAGERAHQAMEFSPPITEEVEGEEATGAQVTTTLEPSSPENVEPVEQPEEAPIEFALPTRAEPEISELTETHTQEHSETFAVTDSEVPEPNSQPQAQMASLEAATTAGIDLTSQDDLEDEVGDLTSHPHSETPACDDNQLPHHQPDSHAHPEPGSGSN
uniref:Death domain-containing protein n=1 Tax=Rodentolepis nana TaxID=102285 RepID=A0A0R3TAI2_RODNA